MGLMKLRDMQGLRWMSRLREQEKDEPAQMNLFDVAKKMIALQPQGGAGERGRKAKTKELS